MEASNVILPQQFFSNDIYQRIIDTIPAPIFWKDTFHRLMGCNKAFANNTGYYDVSELIGKTDYDLPWKEFAEKYIEDDSKIMREKIQISYEEENRPHDGQLRYVLVTKSPLYDRNKQVIGVVGTYIDITDKKKAEQFLAEKQEFQKNIVTLN